MTFEVILNFKKNLRLLTVSTNTNLYQNRFLNASAKKSFTVLQFFYRDAENNWVKSS